MTEPVIERAAPRVTGCKLRIDAPRVIGGIEALRALRRSDFQPRRSIELIVFTSEEPTRFGIGCIGSRVLTGALDAARLAVEAAARDSGSPDSVATTGVFQGQAGAIGGGFHVLARTLQRLAGGAA